MLVGMGGWDQGQTSDEGTFELALKMTKISILENSVCQEHIKCDAKGELSGLSLYILARAVHFIKLAF